MTETIVLPATNQPAMDMIDECLDVATPVIGILINSTYLPDIRATRANWIKYLADHASETAGCQHWIEAWELFWNSYNIA